MNNKIIINAENISKIYKTGKNQVLALDSINLQIHEGDFVSVTGTSGSGKSTLLHLLGTLDKPTSGEITLFDRNISELKEGELAELRREHIGFVFQKFCLLQELSVYENIVFPVLLAGKEVNNDYISQLCQTLGLEERMNHIPSELSGGQQQRVAIARALANQAEMILCDEPTGNLDKKTSLEVMGLLKTVHENFGKTIIVVTHDPEIAGMADYMIHIEDGRIIE